MFKTSFSKYLAAFVITILVSFAILSGIITSMVRNYAFSDTEQRLEKEGSIIVNIIRDDGIMSIGDEIYQLAEVIEPMVNLNSDYDVIIIDANGKIVLSTAHGGEENKKPLINLTEGMGRVDITRFEKQIGSDGEASYVYNGKIGNSAEQYMAYAKPVERAGKIE